MKLSNRSADVAIRASISNARVVSSRQQLVMLLIHSSSSLSSRGIPSAASGGGGGPQAFHRIKRFATFLRRFENRRRSSRSNDDFSTCSRYSTPMAHHSLRQRSVQGGNAAANAAPSLLKAAPRWAATCGKRYRSRRRAAPGRLKSDGADRRDICRAHAAYPWAELEDRRLVDIFEPIVATGQRQQKAGREMHCFIRSG